MQLNSQEKYLVSTSGWEIGQLGQPSRRRTLPAILLIIPPLLTWQDRFEDIFPLPPLHTNSRTCHLRHQKRNSHSRRRRRRISLCAMMERRIAAQDTTGASKKEPAASAPMERRTRGEEGESGNRGESRNPGEQVIRWERFLPCRVLRVLLVENDDSTRHIVAALLRKCSYQGNQYD